VREKIGLISENTLRHIYEKHEDLVEMLNIKNMRELKEAILDILQNPDEVHEDKYKKYVKEDWHSMD